MLTAQQLADQARANIQEIKVETLSESELEKHWIIDVREPTEFQEGHLPGATHIPRGVLEFKIMEHETFKSADHPSQLPILLYCRSGGRSALAAEALQKMGFNQVYSLAGGYTEWHKQNKEIEK